MITDHPTTTKAPDRTTAWIVRCDYCGREEPLTELMATRRILPASMRRQTRAGEERDFCAPTCKPLPQPR